MISSLASGIGFLLLGTALAEAQRTPRGVLGGFVRDSSGDPVVGAEVRLLATNASVLTDSAGAFRLTVDDTGSSVLSVRRLGFRPWTGDVRVGTASTPLEVHLVVLPSRLPAVMVQGAREAFDERLSGYRERVRNKAGYFITRERMERSHAFGLTDLFREVPGVRVVARGSTRSLRIRGARCPPLVYIDGTPASAGDFDLDIVDPATVEGIEVYSGLMRVPPELSGPADLAQCGVIAIWSRPFRPRPRTRHEPADLERLIAERQVFPASEVDRPPVLVSGSGVASYPDSLRQAGTSGRAVVEFVVDLDGRVEERTARVVSASDPAFAEAALRAAVAATFSPARRQGRLVRALIQLPFVFGSAIRDNHKEEKE